MQQANFPSLTPRPTPTMQLQQFQQQHGLGQYAQPRVASMYGGGMQQQQQMYRPDLGGLGQQQFSNGIVGSMGGQPMYRPDSGMQSTGIGGSTPFLSGLQQQLGNMFGQTPGLGFRPQPPMQSYAPPPPPQSTYGGGYNGAIPMRSPLVIPAGASPMMKAGYAAINNLGRS